MRLTDVVLASVMLGLVFGLVHTGLPALKATEAKVATSDCGRSMCERLTWLRTPLMRGAAQAH